MFSLERLTSLSLLLFLYCLPGASPLPGKDLAIIISGQVANQSAYDAVTRDIDRIHRLMERQGLSSGQIITCFDDESGEYIPSRKSEILAAIEARSTETEAGDRHWLFLLGHGQQTSRATQITTRGPRLSVDELVDALNAWKGDVLAFALNRQSAAFLDALKARASIVVTAHDDPGQLNFPVFNEYLLPTWLALPPQTPLVEVLRQAGEKTARYYEERGLVKAERSQVYDGASTVSYPYQMLAQDSLLKQPASAISGGDPAPRDRPQVADNASPPVSQEKGSAIEDLEKIEAPESEGEAVPESDPMLPERQHATDETSAIIEKGKALVADYQDHGACFIEYDKGIEIGKNRRYSESAHFQLMILDPLRAEQHERYYFSQSSQRQFTLKLARIIYPDGTFRELRAESRQSPDGRIDYAVSFPELEQNCVIELSYTHQYQPDYALPMFHYEYELSQDYPIADGALTLSHPKNEFYAHKLYNLESDPLVSETRFSKIFAWELSEIETREYLPHALPNSERSQRLVVSSLESWDEFHGFAQRVFDGVDEVDESTRRWVLEQTKGLESDVERLRVLYDAVCDMRYSTKPVGLRALRPHTPAEVLANKYGDCKDKANALVSFARVLGIEGHFVLLNRTQSTDETFPSWQFNHALAYFPELEGFPDGLWLDPTDRGTPFASLPPGDFGRTGMVFTQDDYYFQETFLGDTAPNKISHSLDVSVESGRLEGTITIVAQGYSAYDYRTGFRFAPGERRRLMGQQIVDEILPMVDAEKVRYEESNAAGTQIKLVIDVSGDFSDYTLNRINTPMQLWQYVSNPSRDYTTRINDGQPVEIDFKVRIRGDLLSGDPYQDTWSAENDYLSANVATQLSGRGLTQNARIQLRQADIPPEDYTESRRLIFQWIHKNKLRITDKI